MLLGEFFPPNCRIKIRGEHFYTDRKLYSNIYGIAFFPDSYSYGNNPYISPLCEKLPGILEDYFPHENADDKNFHEQFDIRDAITANVDEKFHIAQSKKKSDGNPIIECTFLGHISHETEDSVLLTYGAVIPTTLCITGDDTISAVLPFSPFPNLTFLKSNRTFMTVDYPVPTEPLMPPEDITIDFAVTTRKMKIMLNDDLTGKIILEYSIEVGVTKCDVSKITIEIFPMKGGNPED